MTQRLVRPDYEAHSNTSVIRFCGFYAGGNRMRCWRFGRDILDSRSQQGKNVFRLHKQAVRWICPQGPLNRI